MTIDLTSLWDFTNPTLSEEHFRAALPAASADDALILYTQIARTYGLRRQFPQAQQILADIEPHIYQAAAEPQIRYYLELGRTYASAAHPPESQTAEARAAARTAFLRAAEIAQLAHLDYLAIDALHMMTFVDTDPDAQVAWNNKALEAMHASSQPEAKKWAGSLHNNMGYALHVLGRYTEALAEFKLALAAHEQSGKPQSIRIAHWMVAWTLRSLGQLNEALAIQLRLEGECAAAGEPDPYVFEELELLYTALGDAERAEYYAERRKATA